MIQRAGNADALALSAGQLHATFAHRGVDTLGQFVDDIADMRHLDGTLQLILVDLVVRHPEGNVLADTGIGQENTLRHVADGILPRAAVVVGYDVSIDA